MCEACAPEDWFGAAVQNRWQGVIFKGHPDAAIVPECIAMDPHLNLHNLSNTVNQHWSVQRKGTLLAQKLEGGRFSHQAGDSRIWISSKGLSEPWVAFDRGPNTRPGTPCSFSPPSHAKE